MDITKKMCSISAKQIRCEDTLEHTVESEITLPEYFPDIVSVLRSTLKPNISQTKLQSGKLTVDGTALISVLYIGEDKKLHCFEQRIPFTKSVEISNSDNCYAVSDVQTQFVNCRVSSQRKLSIHSSISVKYKLFFKHSDNILTSCEESTIQMKKNSDSVTVLRDCQMKSFVINETIELGSAQDSIGQIVRSEAAAILDSVKLVAGKALIKGELKVKITYLTEKECMIECMESSMPISQIVEIDSADDSVEFTSLRVSSVDVFAKTDSSGALRMFDLSACVNAELDIYDNNETECISDIYSTEYELIPKREKVSFSRLSDRISDTYLCRGIIDSGDKKIKAVLDINSRSLSYTTDVSDNIVCISGVIGINAVLAEENEEVSCIEKEIEFEYKCNVKAGANRNICKSNVILSSMNYTISGESKIDIRAELDISCVVFENYEKEVLVDISADENSKKEKNNASLTIYFSDENESIWNIAKRYNTTVKAILEENKLSDDTVREKTKLLIPCR